jgi:hypothetical protein
MKLGFFVLLFFHAFRFLDFRFLDPTIVGQTQQLLNFLVLVIVLSRYNSTSYGFSKSSVVLFMLIPIFSGLPAYFNRGQSFVLSLQSILHYSTILIYFYLHQFQIKIKTLLDFIMVVSILRVVILIIQQFSFPSYLFIYSGRDLFGADGTEIEVRSGIYRYLISDSFLNVFSLFYAYNALLNKYTYRSLFILIISIIGLYLDQTRQLLFVVGVILMISLFFNLKSGYKLIFCLCLVIVYYSGIYDFLFNDLNEQTKEEAHSENYRFLAAQFYFFNYWNGYLTYIFGNGIPNMKSTYGAELANIIASDKVYRVDIGVIGGLNQFGIFGVISFLSYYLRIFWLKWSHLELYLKMFVLSTLLNIFLIFPLIMPSHYNFFLGVFMYLIDKSFIQKRGE